MSLAGRVDAVIDAALGERIVGCVVLIDRGGERLYARAAGFADREAGIPAREDTIFRLASVTKPIIATACLRMVDRGLLSLDDRVADHLPFFTPKAPDGSRPDIRIRQLLTHTSGLAYGVVPPDVTRGHEPAPLISLEENLRRLAAVDLAFAPGTAWDYGMSIDVLGAVLASIDGDIEDVEGVATRYVTGPLGMTDTHFFVDDPDRLAYPYADGSPRPIRMAEPQRIESMAGSAAFWSPKRIFQRGFAQCSGSGMAGTAGDFARLLTALQGDFLAPATRDAALSNQIGDIPRPTEPGQKFGFIGAVVEDAAASGWHLPGLLHWGGTWGNHWFLDPRSGTSVVVYTNTLAEGCNGAFRSEMRDAVFA